VIAARGLSVVFAADARPLTALNDVDLDRQGRHLRLHFDHQGLTAGIGIEGSTITRFEP
jgi:hypothetical protein